ncbi:type II toxin-antitoxin system Phd/YefM family antitoxin [Photorhabdus bodei]|uniref:Antitoxin n=1 Tax=Photorhabdus bodei TaxID=2029681 RepID=A0ABX0AQK7_9GAMM|nr:type II toxin-antitoxin system Phd/YefM family antitoxin [Photorhabdus bodei]NDL01058.1 type II toxin-antitoxin system prevent-host-death family antitoxin [Photorhabdus bodei]NDL05351.1 type II toxin-antitoxin system prevent-host-death family antitoxin [Photorhabdus bodei]NDL09561.1 type II toxin-antitoxin system prevent-host-death family antitoxin [Photorhabdus bodei]
MYALSANEAKTHFGDVLLRAQCALIQINKNGKPVAVVLSIDEYENIEALKIQLLKSRVIQAKADIEAGNLVDGESFFDELETGKYD